MASVSSADVINLFKKVYGDLTDLVPKDQLLSKLVPFSQKQRVGESYVEAVVLSSETGITFSSSGSAFDLNPPRAGVVSQASVVPFVSVLASIVPWSTISRSAGGGVRAFYDATKFVVRNNLKSHEKFQEIIRLYGQAPSLLGYQSHFTGTYRGVSFTDGSATLDGLTFVNGAAPAANGNHALLLGPGSFAAGIWVGMEGLKVLQVNDSGTVVASGDLVSVNSEFGYIIVDFTPVATTSSGTAGTTTSSDIRVCFDGMQAANDYIGVDKILTTDSGNLFGINTADYSLWQGSQLNLNHTAALTLSAVQDGIANMVNRSGMEGDLVMLLNPRTWASLSNNDAALRVYDSSYRQAKDEAGWEQITYYSQTGKITMMPHRCVKEGDAFALHVPTWSRSGSADVSFTVPGMPHEIIFPLENQAGYAFRSYADQYLFCHAPAQNLKISGINDEL